MWILPGSDSVAVFFINKDAVAIVILNVFLSPIISVTFEMFLPFHFESYFDPFNMDDDS